MHSWEWYFGAYFPSCEATRERHIHQHNTRVNAYSVRNDSRVIPFLKDIMNPYMKIKRRFSQIDTCFASSVYVLLMTSPSIADAVTISSSLDFDFTHVHIHGRSCKKWNFITCAQTSQQICRFTIQKLYHIYHHSHDDVIKWKHFPRYWPFVRVIHRSPVNSPFKGQWRGA